MSTTYDTSWSSGLVDRLRLPLPAPLTALVGRAAELEAVRARLLDPRTRLVTVTGVGGVGKTRLAIEAARSVGSEAFPDGVFLVELTPGDEPGAFDSLATTIAATLGMPLSGPDPASAQVASFLRGRRAMLLLDSVERLSDAALPVGHLLEHVPGLTVLATSRVPLGLPGEWVVALDGLPVPSADAAAPEAARSSAAVELFVQTAQRLAPGGQLPPEDLLAAVQICRMVGGLPLGVELAASWARFMSCREIAAEIAQSFDFLSAAGQGLPDRHQSLRTVFSSSWVLLTEVEQRAMRRLSIFPAGFSRAAAAAVAETPLPVLASLVSKSLVRRLAPGSDGETRYELPQPLRPYVLGELERAGEIDLLVDRHSAYFLAQLSQRTAALMGPEQQAALEALSAEIADIRAAWRQAASRGAAGRIAPAIVALFQLYNIRSWFAEGAELFGVARAALEPAAAEPGEARTAWARLLAREAWFVFQVGRQQEARGLLQRAVDALRDAGALEDLVWALSHLGAICLYLGDDQATEQLCREGLAMAERRGDTYGRVVALSNLSQMAYRRGDYAAARSWGEQSLALERRLGSPWSIAFSLVNLGTVGIVLRDHAGAQQLLSQALEIRRILGDIRGAALCLSRLGEVSSAQGNAAAALERHRESLQLFRTIGNLWGMADQLVHLGRMAIHAGAERAAAWMLAEALALASEIGAEPLITTSTAALSRLAGPGPDGRPRTPEQLAGWARLHGAAALDEAIAQLTAALARPAPPAPQPPTQSPMPAGLTSREIEVLQLVATGLTDAQVADRLIISRRTVHAHLASIYGKIGVNTRTAASRFAVEQGIAL